jgi:hypothetical protein
MQESERIHPNGEPDEEAITALLEKFRPRPSAAYTARMQSAPWQSAAAPAGHRIRKYAWRFALAALLVSVFFLFTPFAGASLKTTAKRLLQFFIPAASDQTEIQVIIPPSEQSSVLNPQTDLTTSLQDVQAQAAFEVRVPAQLPEDFAFSGGNYAVSRRQAALYYTGANRSLMLVQHPIGNYFEQIGESARVEIVHTGEITYEYVTGGWVIRGKDGQVLATALPGSTVTLNANWDNDLNRQTVRWQEAGIQFELIGYGELDRSTLLSIAANMR